jgi:hypothetical protein
VSTEIINIEITSRMIGTLKVIERCEKHYLGLVIMGVLPYRAYPKPLKRKFRTKTQAKDYIARYCSTWARLHPEIKPLAKK